MLIRIGAALAALLTGGCLSAIAHAPAAAIRIGVVSPADSAASGEAFLATAGYLEAALPGRSFKVLPLTYGEAVRASQDGSVDFLIVDPALYVRLEAASEISAIATLRRQAAPGCASPMQGAVVFCRADRTDIRDAGDLRDKVFAAVRPCAGCWLSCWRELAARAIEPSRDFARLEFLHDAENVVSAVEQGRADAGAVSIGVLERLAGKGHIRLSTFRVMRFAGAPHPEAFPLLASTRLYPSAAFAKSRGTPDELAQRVASALFAMPPDHPAAKAANSAGWTVPHNYGQVRACLRTLRLPPYQNHGDVPLNAVLRQHRDTLLAALLGIVCLLGIVSITMLHLNRKLRRTQRALQTELSERRQSEEALRVTVQERQKLEEQIVRMRKMDALGRMAGGLAHDFNNLLTVIEGYSEVLLEELAPDDRRRKDVEQIRSAGERGAALTRQLLAFSRKQVLQTKVINLNSVIAGMDCMLGGMVGKTIPLEFKLQPGLRNVQADLSQVEQVIMNLVLNARDAMPGGGRLEVETADVTLEDPPGAFVKLSITDSGTGMDLSIQSRIFEPFFTTKASGQGTGLGLATVYGIVHQSGGWIGLRSAPGQGTRFDIYLPTTTEPLEPANQTECLREPRNGSGTILLVDDDDALRQLVRVVLEKHGYHVLDAASGTEALAVAALQDRPICLMVTDIVMPAMNGKELAAQMAVLRPRTRVLFMSGFSDGSAIGLLDANLFLQKPFTPEALVTKVRQTLGAGGDAVSG